MAERFEIVEKALLKMLEEKKYAGLRDILLVMNPSDIAELFYLPQFYPEPAEKVSSELSTGVHRE
mgnify:CR=1 FL=1